MKNLSIYEIPVKETIVKDNHDPMNTESLLLFRKMVESSIDVMYRLNISTGRFEYMSPSSREFIGYTPEEMCGFSAGNAAALIHPDDILKVKESVHDFLSGKTQNNDFQKIEYRLKHKNGSYRWFYDLRRPGYDEKGRLKFIEGSGRDITDRKSLENILVESEEKYSRVVEQSADGIVIIQDFNVVFVNRAMCEMCGYTKNEMIGMHLKELVPEEKGEFISRRYQDRLAGLKVPEVYEIAIKKKDGENLDVELSGAVINFRGKAADLVTLRDITERKKAQKAIKESEEKYRTLVESFGIGIALINPSMELFTINNQIKVWFSDLVEFRAALQKAGLDFSQFVNDQADSNSLVYRLMKEKVVVETELEITQNGMRRICRLIATPLKDEDGEIQNIIIMIDDITERKKTEDGLKRAYDFQKQILSTAATAIFTMDAQKIITSVNDEFCATTGYNREDVIGKSCLILEGMPCIEFCGLFDGDRDAKIFKKQCSLISKDGRRLFILKNASLVRDEKGEVTGGIESFIDVTELISAREEAIAADKAKSEFLANMSHEIRTPLNGIIGMTQLALETELTPELREYLELSKSSADSLLSLLNDILDFSKIEAGKLDIDNINFSLRECLGVTMSTMALRAHNKRIELAYHIPNEIPDALIGDPGRLRQIIINLVGNAIKFTMKGEIITTITPVSEDENSLTLHFMVEDTGIGIPQNMLTSIFDPFIQADGSTKRRFGGTGLGLAISARLVEIMGGKIWVESEENKGTKFHFTISFEVQKNPVGKWDRLNLSQLIDMPVLVVDDNYTNRKILFDILKGWKMKPNLTADGYEALKAIKEAKERNETFPLILLDGQMPEMDGFQLAENIRNDKDGEAPAIIMLTSSGQRGDARKCRELGISAYLTKPVKHFDLLDTITEALCSKQSENQNPELITKYTIEEKRTKMKILLVEDNSVNRKFITSLLRKRGYILLEAFNGREAVESFKNEQLDLILMDIQMPEMDGVEATNAIRDLERETDSHIPIIAMTAHAMKGDRERFLQAGMDGYISKPVQVNELLNTIEEINHSLMKNISGSAGEKTLISQEESLIDKDNLMARIDNDMELLKELSDLFNEDSDRLLKSIHMSIQDNDLTLLERQAHTIKSSVSNFSKGPAFEVAHKLEFMARDRKLENVMEIFNLLKNEVDRIKIALSDMAKEGA